MTPEEHAAALKELSQKVDALSETVHKTHRYLQAAVVIAVVSFVLPLLILPFAAAKLMGAYTTVLSL